MIFKTTDTKQKTQNIKSILFDVDGVLTDGGIIYDDNHIEYKRYNVKDGQIAYIGNDIIDLSILVRCGLSVTPNDARAYIKNEVDIVTLSKGEEGELRDVADYILDA